MGWFGWLLLGVFWFLVIVGIVYLVRAVSTRERFAIDENGEPVRRKGRKPE